MLSLIGCLVALQFGFESCSGGANLGEGAFAIGNFPVEAETPAFDVDALGVVELTHPLEALVLHTEGDSHQRSEFAPIKVVILQAQKEIFLESFLGEKPIGAEIATFDVAGGGRPMSHGGGSFLKVTLRKILHEKAAERSVVDIQAQAFRGRCGDLFQDFAKGEFFAPVEDEVLLIFGKVAENVIRASLFDGRTHIPKKYKGGVGHLRTDPPKIGFSFSEPLTGVRRKRGAGERFLAPVRRQQGNALSADQRRCFIRGTMYRNLIALLLLAWASVVSEAYDPTANYQETNIVGFRVLVSSRMIDHPSELQLAFEELGRQRTAIALSVEPPVLEFLQTIPIWLEWAAKTNGAAEYHPSREWLIENGYNPEKAGCIEINNAANFVRWSKKDQPSMLLHELAHAFHDQVLGWKDADVKNAFRQARESGRYEKVAYVNGGKTRSYALTNEKEYFAELTEAYFGRNDFYPFIRSELEAFDAAGFSVIAKKWKTLPSKERQRARD